MEEQDTKLVCVKLSLATKDKLHNLSKTKFKSVPWLIMKSIEDYIEREETKVEVKQETVSSSQETEIGIEVSDDINITNFKENGKGR